MSTTTSIETNVSFDGLEKDFQRVLNDIISDKSLEKFRTEYEKLHSALQRSHGNEKKLIIKCRELNDELINNASKVGTAMKLSSEDQNSIALLKTEIDKAWKMVDVAQEKEKKAKRTIQQLRAEIQNLSTLVEGGHGLNIGQESTVNELLRLKEELSKEVESQNKKIEVQQKEINELNVELVTNEENRCKYQSKLGALNKELGKTKQDLSRYSRRSERSEKQLLDIKSHLDETKLTNAQQKAILKDRENDIAALKNVIKNKNDNINRQNHEFDSLKLQCQELLEQLSINKEEEIVSNKEKKDLILSLKQKDCDIALIKSDIVHWRKESDKLHKNELNLMDKIKEITMQKSKLKEEIGQIQKDLKLQKSEFREKEKKMTQINLDLKRANSSNQTQKKKNNELKEQIKSYMTKIKELSSDLSISNQKIILLKKSGQSLEKKSERLAMTTNEWHSKNKKLKNEIDVLHIEADDIQNTVREERGRLKTQQQLYENIRSERNLFCQNLNEAQDEIAEMKRKFKIMTHQIEQYKEETTTKDRALIKQHFELKELSENVKSLEKQKIKKDEILQSSDKLLSAQDTEIKTLRRTLCEAESSQKSQKQVFDAVVDERDILGAQLIRRNDELALLYDKVRLMESTLEKGEHQYRDRVEDVRNLKLQLKDLKRQLTIRNTQYSNMNKLKYEVHHLQRELLQERTKVKALSEELENPINVHRWRKLSGSDPDQFESIQKIHTLQKRLIEKTEQIVEKDLIIQEKERLYVELKNILARQPGPEVIEQITVYQNTLKQRTRQIKSNTAEMNMLQTQLSQYKFDVNNLTNQLITIKKKYYQQKKKEQLWKEQSRNNAHLASTNSLHSAAVNQDISMSTENKENVSNEQQQQQQVVA